MRLFTIGFVALPLLAWSARALAAEPATHQYPECTREASEQDLTAAKAAYQAGNVSFNEADYPRALLYWEDAYRRDCNAHMMLFNLARAYESNGQKRQAVIALETLLQREPNTPERAQITRRIEVLKKQIEQEDAAAAALPPPPPASTTAAAPESTAPPAAPATHSDGRPVLPLVIAGIGGAVVIVGGIVWLGATSDVRKYEKICPKQGDEYKCPPDQTDAIKPANEAAKRQTASGAVTAFVGIPLLAGGLIWYFASTPGKHPAALVTPSVAPGYAGLTLDTRF
jgi:tetratricopeptide (TPR) repeat protein